MEIITYLIDFILHVDKHLEVFVQNYGTWVYALLFLIIFVETGVVVMPFLPGDSLLFITGLLIAQGTIGMNIGLACLILFLAAVLGNITGYWIGYKAGPSLFNKPDSKLFRKEYVDKTHEFFEKYGARAIVLARFVPIVRTFITAVAGIGRMDFKRYLIFSAIGGLLWAVGVTLAGYWLGNIEFVKKNIAAMRMAKTVSKVAPYCGNRRATRGSSGAGANSRPSATAGAMPVLAFVT